MPLLSLLSPCLLPYWGCVISEEFSQGEPRGLARPTRWLSGCSLMRCMQAAAATLGEPPPELAVTAALLTRRREQAAALGRSRDTDASRAYTDSAPLLWRRCQHGAAPSGCLVCCCRTAQEASAPPGWQKCAGVPSPEGHCPAGCCCDCLLQCGPSTMTGVDDCAGGATPAEGCMRSIMHCGKLLTLAPRRCCRRRRRCC